jgi:hypothetical protein
MTLEFQIAKAAFHIGYRAAIGTVRKSEKCAWTIGETIDHMEDASKNLIDDFVAARLKELIDAVRRNFN